MNNQDNMLNPQEFFSSTEIESKGIKNRYTIQKLNGWDAWDGWTLILKIIGPVFGEVIDSRNVDEVSMFEQQHTFKNILTLVVNEVGKPEMRGLVQQMLNGATVNGQPLDINSHFQGKVHLMQQLIVFALKENFEGFFTESDIFPSVMSGLSKVMNGIVEE